MDIKIYKRENLKDKLKDESKLGFGEEFTDYMFIMDYNKEKGWYDPRIVPYGPLPLEPSSTVFHYGAEVFEGLKAYRRPDGSVQLFRPTENIKRINNSAERLCLPQLNEEDALEALTTLVQLDQDWVPHEEGTSLYIRPFIIGNDPKLGVHACDNAMFIIILSPSGSYYKEGINPVKIMIETEDVRAVRGGTGYTKCGGNYAASTRAGERAEKLGFAQVLWLDGVHQKYIEEVGSMNIMFKIDGKIVTPSLYGTVLPGITRKSCITLMKDWGYEVEERLISVDELFEASVAGKLEEAWGTGTAAVVSPVSHLHCNGQTFIINNGEIGEVTKRLYHELTAIQKGIKEDTYNWTYPIPLNK